LAKKNKRAILRGTRSARGVVAHVEKNAFADRLKKKQLNLQGFIISF
jgi:hypothetical protein